MRAGNAGYLNWCKRMGAQGDEKTVKFCAINRLEGVMLLC